MPCGNVTEIIEVQLDDRQCLERYEFFKQTCGKDVGRDELLQERLVGLNVSELLELNPAILHGETRQEQEAGRSFLNFKHLFAIQAALQVWTGISPGGPDSPCAIIGVEYDAESTLLRAQLDVDLVTSNIMACGHCHGG
ncbi:MAG: hypothetical protein ABIJ61_00805 [bacterium]